MGKLFWKFFIVIWLALLTMGGSMGGAFWLQRNAVLNANGASRNQPQIAADPAAPYLNTASLIANKGGMDGLRSFLAESRHNPAMPPIFAIDDVGKDVLGREVAPNILAQAKSLAASHSTGVRRIKTDEGQSYLLFALYSDNNSARNPKQLHPDPPPPWLPITLGFFISLIFSGVSAWYFAKPIRQLQSAFSAVARGDLDTRAGQIMSQRHDELADLGKSFDYMVSQIQLSVNAQQRLLHDVSHELRSPLARIQTAIGLAYQQPDKIPLTLERIEKESQRMNDLIGELLAISRLEAGVIGKLEVIDINELLSEIVEDARLEADSKHVGIDLNIAGEIFLQGYYDLLSRAIENVLRNAVKYTRRHSKVSVNAKLCASGRQLHIDITDQGPGVAETELSAIFDPFFRGSHHQTSQGIGLGLTIALKALETHHGKIKVGNRPEGGLKVEIMLPAA